MRNALVIPGHLGATPGAAVPSQQNQASSGNYYKLECEITYDIAIAVIRAAALCGWTAQSTYGSFARKADATLRFNPRCVIEIHCNSAENKAARGFEIWYDGDNESKKLAGAIVSRIDMIPLRNPPVRAMHEWANTRRALFDTVKLRPCVLIECGFLSNPDDVAILTNPTAQRALGLRIAQGIAMYFDPTLSFPDEWTWYA
jgi:N-acetylmuramoyl-L-alanine amidase